MESKFESKTEPNPNHKREDKPEKETTTDSEAELETSVMFELGKRMMRLYLCDDHACDRCRDDIDFVNSENDGDSETISNRLLQLGMLELFQQIWRKHFSQVEEVEEDEVTDSLLSKSCNIVVNMTDASSECCDQILLLELHVDIINYLKSEVFSPNGSENDLSHAMCIIVDGLMSVLYNVIQSEPEARELFREQGIVEVLQRFRDKTDDSVKCMVLILLAWVINDDENSLITSDGKVFRFLEIDLKSALHEDSHRSVYGYKVRELLAAINKLAVNDDNKSAIIQSGILSSYVILLQTDEGDLEEQLLAAQGIWTLAFKCAEDIKKEPSCVKNLESLLITSEHDVVRRQARGALQALGIVRESPPAPRPAATAVREGEGKRVFISYQHQSKDTVFQIRDRLREKGYTIWLDADDMSGSLGEDITEGIDKASMVLVCLSQKYYESPYCKKEVIYADESRKDIIPLNMEPKYKPHGWLMFRMTDKLRIDFSRPETFDNSLRTLFQRINKSGEDQPDNGPFKEAKAEEKACHVTVTGKPVVVGLAIPEVSSWTVVDVKKWMIDNKLLKLERVFRDFDGGMLLTYRDCLLRTAPESMTKSFLRDYSTKYLVNLIQALKKLD